MNFITIKNAIIEILETASAAAVPADQFEVLQTKQRRAGSSDISNEKKVAVYFVGDDFSTDTGTTNGEVQSTPTFRIVPTVAASGSYSDPDDPSTITSAEINADEAWDAFASQIYLILMNAENIDLGLAVGTISKRYIQNIIKTDLAPVGKKVVVTGQMNLTCSTAEPVSGETGVTGTDVNNNIVISNADADEDTALQAVTAPN